MAASHQTQVEYKKLPTLREPQDTVTIYVRARENLSFQKYIIHKNFICYYSGYFDAALHSNFKEGESQEIHLEDTRASDVFGVFVNWMYTQKLILSEGSPLFIFWSYVALWTFAEMRIIPKLQNQVLRELDPFRVEYDACQHPWAYRFAYKNTTEGSPLRQYLVDTWDNRKIKDIDDYPQELLLDIVNSIGSRHLQRGRLSEAELTKYFVDEEPVRRIRTKSATVITNSPANKITPPNVSTSSKRRRDERTTEDSESKSNTINSNSTI